MGIGWHKLIGHCPRTWRAGSPICSPQVSFAALLPMATTSWPPGLARPKQLVAPYG